MELNERIDLPKGLIVLLALGFLLVILMWLGDRNTSDPYSQAASVPAVNQGVVSDNERAAIDAARMEPAE